MEWRVLDTGFHLSLILFSLVGFKGNLSLLQIFVFFSGGLSKLEDSLPEFMDSKPFLCCPAVFCFFFFLGIPLTQPAKKGCLCFLWPLGI